MPALTNYDLILMVITGGLFVVGLWSTVFAFLYGFLKRLDTIILLLEAKSRSDQKAD